MLAAGPRPSGKKPLYYFHDNRLLVFASEIKALLAHPAVPRESALDAHALALYLGYGYLPAPQTAFQHIRALLPGHMLLVTGREIEPVPYWTPPYPEEPRAVEETQERQYAESLLDLLGESVRLRLLSDVPLGAFLSGGLDSSLIAAAMCRHSNAAVKTFSIGFEGDDSFDETPYARQVAELLETEHTAFTVKADAWPAAEAGVASRPALWRRQRHPHVSGQ
jgi:asparagine synthase (glutamine-hydrolysing)